MRSGTAVALACALLAPQTAYPASAPQSLTGYG